MPEKVALDAAGFFVGRARHKRPLGEVWRIGMRHVATDKDYEAIIMDGFHSSGPFPSCMTLGRHESEFHDRRRCPGATQAPKVPCHSGDCYSKNQILPNQPAESYEVAARRRARGRGLLVVFGYLKEDAGSSGQCLSRMLRPSFRRDLSSTWRCPALPKKGVWNFQALKTPAFIETGEFQTPFLGKAASALIRRSSLLVERLL
ncbi:MAG: hypothetical protein E6K70_18485 [Planctomycetota bacterium]|nr:MAG: hypothetical protein E6K70_18485 [Planctomycetota bacterium]